MYKIVRRHILSRHIAVKLSAENFVIYVNTCTSY